MASTMTFSKTGVTTWQPTYDPTDPYADTPIRGQWIGENMGGTILAADQGYTETFFRLHWDTMSKTNRDALITFVEDSKILFNAYTFTYTDSSSVTHTVRFWELDGIDFPEVTGDIHTVNITLREEVA